MLLFLLISSAMSLRSNSVFVTAEQTQRQTLQMLAHSLVLRACSVCALTQTHSPRIHTAKNGQACIQIMWLSEQAVGWEGMSFNGLKWKELQAWEVFRFPAHSFQRRKRFIQKHHVSHSFYLATLHNNCHLQVLYTVQQGCQTQSHRGPKPKTHFRSRTKQDKYLLNTLKHVF